MLGLVFPSAQQMQNVEYSHRQHKTLEGKLGGARGGPHQSPAHGDQQMLHKKLAYHLYESLVVPSLFRGSMLSPQSLAKHGRKKADRQSSPDIGVYEYQRINFEHEPPPSDKKGMEIALQHLKGFINSLIKSNDTSIKRIPLASCTIGKNLLVPEHPCHLSASLMGTDMYQA